MEKEYEIEQISEREFGVIKYKYFKVKKYDGNEEKLEEFVKKLNEDSIFNISWYVQDAEKGLIEEMIDTLD